MVDYKKLDSFFTSDTKKNKRKTLSDANIHTKKVSYAKLILPCIAAGLAGLLVIIPNLKQDLSEFSIDITTPRAGELEKLHIEKTVFYITDKSNNVHNFTADNMDETEPGSKLVKITNPEGTMPVNETAWVNIKSQTGFYNQELNTLELNNNVELFYSEGMNIEAPDITFDFKQSKGYSNKPIKGRGFIGDIDAQGFEFYSQTGILVFLGKTKIKIREESLKK